MGKLRNWLFGPPETPAEESLRTGSPYVGPCRHMGNAIAPDIADPDQRLICCGCGRRIDGLRTHYPDQDGERRARKSLHELRVAEFEERKAWAESLPELKLKLRHGEAFFPAIYKPVPFPGGEKSGFYGLAVPVERIMEASGDLPEEHMGRFMEELTQHVKIRPKGETYRSGRPNPIPFDSIYIKGKIRPEVYTLSPGKQENHPESLDYLAMALGRLRARNLPESHLFMDHALVVHVKVSAWWTKYGSSPQYSQMDKSGLSLAPTKVGVWV